MRSFYIKGKITNKLKNIIIIECLSIGYQIEIIDDSLFELNQDYTIYLYEFQYEEHYSLFGFLSNDELCLFTNLLDVKGVGPKTALSLFRKIPLPKLKQYIVESSADSISSLGEIGYQTALEIVSCLKHKMKKQGTKPRSKTLLNVLSAAKSLGFKSKDIEPVLDEYIDTELLEGDLLKNVLTKLRKEQ